MRMVGRENRKNTNFVEVLEVEETNLLISLGSSRIRAQITEKVTQKRRSGRANTSS